MSNRKLVDPIEDILKEIGPKKDEEEQQEEEKKEEKTVPKAKIVSQESKGVSKRTDSKKNLEKLYWTQRKSETMIMYEIGYDNPQEVVNKLIKWGIPIRGPDRSKVIREFLYQNDNTTILRAVTFTADADEVISESFNVQQFRQFNLSLSLSKGGTPTGASIQVFVEFSFDDVTWFPLRDYPWNKAYETNNSIDATNGVSWSRSGISPGDFIRIRFVATGTNLSATAFIILNQVHIALF